MFIAHDVLAFVLAGLLVVKMRRVWRRLFDPSQWDRIVKTSVIATLFVTLALVSGWLWSGGGRISIAGFTLLSWHLVLGWALTAAVAVHAYMRRRRMSWQDATDLAVPGGGVRIVGGRGALAGSASVAHSRLPLAHGAHGSDESAVRGHAFRDVGGWRIASRARPGSYRLRERPRREPRSLDRERVPARTRATLDCTGGFYSTQRWHGFRLAELSIARDERRRRRAGGKHRLPLSFDMRTSGRCSWPRAWRRSALALARQPVRLVARGGAASSGEGSRTSARDGAGRGASTFCSSRLRAGRSAWRVPPPVAPDQAGKDAGRQPMAMRHRGRASRDPPPPVATRAVE